MRENDDQWILLSFARASTELNIKKTYRIDYD